MKYTPIVVGLILMATCFRLSYWQWERHESKLGYMELLDKRLREPITPLNQLIKTPAEDLIHRRVKVAGAYDFEHELVVRNRRLEEEPGVHVFTPLKVQDSEHYLLVNRGFIPIRYSSKSDRKQFQKPKEASFVSLIKETKVRRLFAPKDAPTGEGKEWVDSWLRADLEKISKQLPYPILPYYVEVMNTTNISEIQKEIVKSSATKDEMLFLPQRMKSLESSKDIVLESYPEPVFDTTVPPGRHLGYVFEWAVIGFGILLGSALIQYRRLSAAGDR